jgi:protein subunit release factor A
MHQTVLDVPGKVHIAVEGTDLTQLCNEAGGHRLQRTPPTERKGRVHTSTVVVAVLDTTQYQRTDYTAIDKKDLNVEWYSGSGGGGQHRNKHQNSCRLTHIPTGVMKSAQTRSRESSYKEALRDLIELLQSTATYQMMAAKSSDRKSQMGSGMRGDKVRTFRFQDNVATDHRTGKKVSLSKYMSGYVDLLWN